MRTLDASDRSTAWRRARGNARLLVRLLGMVVGYWTHGHLVRRRLAHAAERGETYWLDRPPA